MTDSGRQEQRNKSARALLFLSGILILMGFVVISPAGRMLFMTIAAICSGISTLLLRGSARTIAILITIVTLVVVGTSYPAYKKHMQLYLERAEKQSTGKLAPHLAEDKVGALISIETSGERGPGIATTA